MELQLNILWTRKSIKEMKIKYGSELKMSAQQIYKWWWDQTKKRSKNQGPIINQSSQDALLTVQDEFGGYNSHRLVNGENIDEDSNVDLCKLLNIDADKLAYDLAIKDLN